MFAICLLFLQGSLADSGEFWSRTSTTGSLEGRL